MTIIKARDILKRLKREGWYIDRISGDHRVLKHVDHPRRRVVVAGHLRDDIPIGTLKNIFEQAGWDNP